MTMEWLELDASRTRNRRLCQSEKGSRRRRGETTFSTFAVLLLSLLLCICLPPTVSGQPLDRDTLQTMKDHLIGDDLRLVRHSAPPETVEIQKDVCPIAIPHIYESLQDHVSISIDTSTDSEEYINSFELRILAAEVLTLCTTDNPKNRAAFGEQPDIHIVLKHMIDEGLRLWREGAADKEGDTKMDLGARAIGMAAQAVWILAFNSEHNVEYFLDVKMIDSLLLVINVCEIDFDEAEENGYEEECSIAVMWSLAALQNLAATYCETEDGLCEWKWTDGHKLELSEDTPKSSNMGDQARFQMVAKIHEFGLKRVITRLVCGGPVHKPDSDLHPWPGTTKKPEEHAYRTSIVPWAAAGFVKNLALNPRIRVEWHYNWNLFECLCDMHYTSPDWLEETKSTVALHHLGWTEQCPEIYDHCEDVEGWNATEDGSTCEDYDEGKYCASHGHWTDANGRSANDACCICGGGVEVGHGDEL